MTIATSEIQQLNQAIQTAMRAVRANGMQPGGGFGGYSSGQTGSYGPQLGGGYGAQSGGFGSQPGGGFARGGETGQDQQQIVEMLRDRLREAIQQQVTEGAHEFLAESLRKRVREAVRRRLADDVRTAFIEAQGGPEGFDFE